jgi:hypothetical protein
MVTVLVLPGTVNGPTDAVNPGRFTGTPTQVPLTTAPTQNGGMSMVVF